LACGLRIERASTLGIDGGQTERLVNICRHFGATRYLSGRAARDYLTSLYSRAMESPSSGRTSRIPVYPQLHGEFIPYMSALDLVLNCGGQSRAVLAGG
jgi:hypothetical protein